MPEGRPATRPSLLGGAVLALLAAPARGGAVDVVGYDTFCATAGMQLNGGAQANPWDSWRAVVLTDDTDLRTSSLFWAKTVDASAGVAIRARIDTAQSHDLVPDGFAIVLQGASPYALGAGGSELGYGGLEGGGLVVEYDFLQDDEWDDPVQDHVAVTWSGTELSPMTVDNQWLELTWEMQYGNVKEYTALVDLAVDADAGTFTVNATTTVLTDYVHEPSYASQTLLVEGELADLGDLDLSNVYVGLSGASQSALGKQYANYLSVTPAGATECQQDFVEAATAGGCAVDAALGSCDAITDCQLCSASSFCCGWDEASGLCVKADDDDVAATLVFLEQCPGDDDDDASEDYSSTSGWATVAWVLVGVLSATTAFLGVALSRRPRRKGYSPVVLQA